MDGVFMDYFVATLPRVNTVEAMEPALSALVAGGQPVVRSGYRGKQKGKVFFGHHGLAQRWMLVLTGEGARDALSIVPTSLDTYLSVARIDVQVTFPVDGGADEFVCSLFPSGRYKARLLRGLTEAGATLYVGSPSSILQARCYNKTAESGLVAPDGRDFVRVEFLLRDRYADRAWNMSREGKVGDAWRALVERMYDEPSAQSILSHAEKGAAAFDASRAQDDDIVSRRLLWLERVVVPALNKMIALEPSSARDVWRALDALAKPE